MKDLANKIEKTKAYHLTGEMQIVNNEDKNLYDIDVSYQKDDQYRVSLKNKTNNHEQIILKNKDGVYVLTPTLNKSFKFQSDWPANNSQAYLLHNIINDIQNDKDVKFTKEKDGYLFEAAASYSNNEDLKKQKIYLDKDLNITKLEVLDKNENVIITMNFQNIDYKATYKDDYFSLNNNMKADTLETTSKTLNDIIYPMYIPEDTKLTSQEKVSLSNGERVILTFSGDKPFTLIEETASVETSQTVIPVSGELEFVADVYGTASDNSVSWISNGVEYYLLSEDMTKNELLTIASSISMLPVSK